MTESDGSLPEGKSLGKDSFRLPKSCLRKQERRLHRVAPGPHGPRTQGTNTPPKTKGYQFLPPEETQGQPAHPKEACCAFSTFGRGGCR